MGNFPERPSPLFLYQCYLGFPCSETYHGCALAVLHWPKNCTCYYNNKGNYNDNVNILLLFFPIIICDRKSSRHHFLRLKTEMMTKTTMYCNWVTKRSSTWMVSRHRWATPKQGRWLLRQSQLEGRMRLQDKAMAMWTHTQLLVLPYTTTQG